MSVNSSYNMFNQDKKCSVYCLISFKSFICFDFFEPFYVIIFQVQTISDRLYSFSKEFADEFDSFMKPFSMKNGTVFYFFYPFLFVYKDLKYINIFIYNKFI